VKSVKPASHGISLPQANIIGSLKALSAAEPKPVSKDSGKKRPERLSHFTGFWPQNMLSRLEYLVAHQTANLPLFISGGYQVLDVTNRSNVNKRVITLLDIRKTDFLNRRDLVTTHP